MRLGLRPSAKARARIWAEDCRFVLDQLERMDGDLTFDLGRVGAIGHSLGCGMINGYLRGLRSDGSFQEENHRFDATDQSSIPGIDSTK